MLVSTSATRDMGGSHDLVINIGAGNGNPTVVGGTLQVDYARAFRLA